MNELHNWLKLWHVPKVGPKTFQFLVGKYPQIEELFSSSYADLINNEVPNSIAEALVTYNSTEYLRDIEWLESSAQHKILILKDDSYPPLLRNIHLPPPILYVIGDVSSLNTEASIAIVGGRKAGSTAKRQAFDFAKQLCDIGVSIISGLARGIDCAAHQGSLAARYPSTIAVLANGLDTIYPAEHKYIANNIIKHGAVISEFPPGVLALPQHFPRRNRIISGLSLGTLVIEAAEKSGSLITAKYALEQGREVFALPGPINNPQISGCHSLIKQGAKLTTNVDDILLEIAAMVNLRQYMQPSLCSNNQQILKPEQSSILNLIEHSPTPIDEIIEKSGLTPERVSSMLTELELGGYVTANAFGQFCRV